MEVCDLLSPILVFNLYLWPYSHHPKPVSLVNGDGAKPKKWTTWKQNVEYYGSVCKGTAMWSWSWTLPWIVYHEEGLIPPLRSSKSAVPYVQQGSIWQPVTRALSDYWHQRDAEREDARVSDCSVVGGQPNNNKRPALSLSPVIFQLSEKLLWPWKKVKLKSLAWYALTTARCLRNTNK